jgi:hypothetical protein
MSRPGFSLVSAIPILVSNLIILALIIEILQDYAYRLSYWRSMGFTPSTTYSPFFFVTSAIRGSTYIPGQLTLDWTQVLAVVLAVMDAAYILGMVRRRRRAAQSQIPQQS